MVTKYSTYDKCATIYAVQQFYNKLSSGDSMTEVLEASAANVSLENRIACVSFSLLPNFSMHHKLFLN